jgi:hypothetical protein
MKTKLEIVDEVETLIGAYSEYSGMLIECGSGNCGFVAIVLNQERERVIEDMKALLDSKVSGAAMGSPK